MGLHVIGAGLGRTGTYSLKLALEQLGLGPCHHMEEVLRQPAEQIPLWSAAVRGQPDWSAIYAGYNCAVDWPTAAFWRQLASAYPQAKFVLTTRDPERWYESFSATIFTLLGAAEHAPAEARPFLEMGTGVVTMSGFSAQADKAGIIRTFGAHNDAVKRTIPAARLLVYQVSEGWEPLCRFLERPVPDTPFPRTNDREEFWSKINNPPH